MGAINFDVKIARPTPQYKTNLKTNSINLAMKNNQNFQFLAVCLILIINSVHIVKAQTAHRLVEEMMKTGFEKVYFAWIGSLENNKPHYYIINAPDFLIEYDNVGFQNDGNHIHAITREKGSDFGEDLLKQHLETVHKKGKN